MAVDKANNRSAQLHFFNVRINSLTSYAQHEVLSQTTRMLPGCARGSRKPVTGYRTSRSSYPYR